MPWERRKAWNFLLSDGIVAQLRGGQPPLIQTTAAISPGSSGGGLFDREGRLVGLTTLYVEGGQNLNFAMPVEWISEVKPGLKPVTQGIGETEWLKRAFFLEQMKDWQGLLDWCRKWNYPKSGSAWNNLGYAYSGLSRHDDAIEAYRQALRINSESRHTWYNLGNAYYNLNRYDDAIEAYRQALSIISEDSDCWNNLGNAYYNLSRYDDAIEAHRQALRIDPKNASAWVNLGRTYGILNRHDDSIEASRQALRIDPKRVLAWNNLAIAYFLSGNRTAALDAVQELRRLDPEKADKLLNSIVPR